LGCAFKALETFYSALKCKKEQPMHMLWNQHPSMHYIWMDTGWTRKLFLTGSLSSMIYMPSLRISTLFWMDVGWTKKSKISLGLYHPWLTCFHKESVYYFGWMLAGPKTFLTESLSSMTHMPSQRISALPRAASKQII